MHLVSSTLVDCQWGNWGYWSACIHPSSCPGSGSRSRTRSKTVAACGGGEECQGSSKEFGGCPSEEICEYHFHF